MTGALPPENIEAARALTGTILRTNDFAFEPFPTEGFMTRVYVASADTGDYIVRHGKEGGDFGRDRYIAENFGGVLPVAQVVGIGSLRDRSALCVSERLPGSHPAYEQLGESGSALHGSFTDTLRRMHMVDLSGRRGYGPVKPNGQGLIPSGLYGAGVRLASAGLRYSAARVADMDADTFKEISRLQRSYEPAVKVAKYRRLVHGDLKSGNVLSDDNQITGIIDWARVSYLDPALDLGIMHVRCPEVVDIMSHAEAVGADPDTIRERTFYYAIGECMVAMSFFHSIYDIDSQIRTENRLQQIANEAETA